MPKEEITKPPQRYARLRFARAYAADKLPWFAPALFRCRIILSPEVKVAAIDRYYNIYWNPEITTLSLPELAFLWVHEISHRLRHHAERADELGLATKTATNRWNVACDLEINDSQWSGLEMPVAYPGRLPKDFNYPEGEIAETYYQWLTDSTSEFSFDLDEGSGIHGQERNWESGDRQEISQLDEELVRREVARQLSQSENAGIPDSWRNWAEHTLGSHTNWRQRLGHRMSIALRRGIGNRTDYSYARPSRRQSVLHPIIRPTLTGDRTARIAIVVDTSASMGVVELRQALTEVASVIRQFHYPATIIPCDLTAYEPVELVAAEEIYKIHHLPGGSGTDMRAGIIAAVNLRPAPDAILVLTDGETPYPTEKVAVPVVFGIFGEGDRKVNLPPDPPWTSDAVVLISSE